MNPALKILFLPSIFLATQCSDEMEKQAISTNNFKVSVTPKSTFKINDTLWVEGNMSSKSKDSTALEDHISLFRLTDPVHSVNAKDALDSFQLIENVGTTNPLGFCKNSDLIIRSKVSEKESSYKLGLKALNPGDYVLILGTNSRIVNSNKNIDIASEYSMPNLPDQIGFNRCGHVSWGKYKDSDKAYYFKVTE